MRKQIECPATFIESKGNTELLRQVLESSEKATEVDRDQWMACDFQSLAPERPNDPRLVPVRVSDLHGGKRLEAAAGRQESLLLLASPKYILDTMT